jgi:hypothetical protein
VSDKQRLSTRVFGDLSREPDGRPQSLVWFGAAGLFWLLSAYFLIANGGVSVVTPLPVARTRVAYLLRVVAIVLVLSVFTLLFV